MFRSIMGSLNLNKSKKMFNKYFLEWTDSLLIGEESLNRLSVWKLGWANHSNGVRSTETY